MFGRSKSQPAEPVAAPAAAEPVSVVPASGGGVFLGSLRSEVDEPETVAEPFERILLITEGVIRAYTVRALTADEAAARLKVLRLMDAEGLEWTLGPTSMRWYRRLPGGSWKIAVPPTRDDDALTGSADRAVDQLLELGVPHHRDPEVVAAAAPLVIPLAELVTEPAGEERTGYDAAYDPTAGTGGAASASASVTPSAAADPESVYGEAFPNVPAVPLQLSPAVSTFPAAPSGGYGDDRGADNGYGDGYGDDSGYGDEPARPAPFFPRPAADAEPAAAPVEPSEVGPGTREAAPEPDVEPTPADDEEAEAENDALAAMLASLALDTGISLKGHSPL